MATFINSSVSARGLMKPLTEWTILPIPMMLSFPVPASLNSKIVFLLNGLKCLAVPFVITAGITTLASSRRVLEEGAFGLIRLPVDGKRASQTLSLATEVKDILRRTTVYRDMLNDYHERLDACPRDPELEKVVRRSNVIFQSTYDMWKETTVHIEQSVERLDRAAVVLQDEARLQAYAQLCELDTKRMS